MKRVIAISNHGQMIGGGERSFLDLLIHLRRTWEILSVVPQNGELATGLRDRGIDTRIIPLSPLRPRYAFKALLSLVGFTRLFTKYCPALVYANGSRAAFYGGIVGRLLRLPVVWHCRIADRDPLLDNILCVLTSCIIANSNATAARFKRGFHNKIRTVYNGIDLQWLTDPSVEKPDFIRSDWKVMLVVARASRDKRHDLILSSFEQAAKQHPDIHLVCLGQKDSLDPLWWDFLQNRTQNSELRERVHWIGQVEDVRPWYKGAHMLLLASENESFGRVAVEAMACGVPVVAARSGGVPEIVRDQIDGILVRAGSANEVYDAVLRLLRDESLRNRLSESGRKRAEEFSLQRHVHQMMEVFEETSSYYARHVSQ